MLDSTCLPLVSHSKSSARACESLAIGLKDLKSAEFVLMAPLPVPTPPNGRAAQEEYFKRLEKCGLNQQKAKVFSADEDYTYSLLEPVFKDLCHGADYERLCEKNQKIFCQKLDECEGINPADCEGYIDSLLELCQTITKECSGKDFHQWQLGEAALLELRKAWRHFVHLVSLRDFDLENLSDLQGETSKRMLRYVISQKLMVPLQMWTLLLKLAAGHRPVLPVHAEMMQRRIQCTDG